MRKILSLFAAVLFAGSMIADEASVSIATYASSHSWANDTKYTSVAIDENVTATVSGGGNTGKYYTSGNEWRLYQTESASITITTASGTLNSITITYATKNTGELKDGTSAVKSGTKVNVSGDSKTFTVGNSGTDSKGQVKITAISVTYTPSASAVSKPTISGKEKFVGETEITIACATEGAAIYYTLDGTTPTDASNAYSAPFTINATKTVKAIAILGSDESAVAEKTFTKYDAKTCAEAAALAKDVVTGLNEVTVTYVNGGNIYVKDATGYELIYAFDFGLVAGDVVNGFIGVSSPYYGLPELKPQGVALADLDVVHGEAPAPEEITAAPTAADINKYLIIKGVSVAAGSFTTESATNLDATIGEETFVLRNNFKLAQTFAADKKYDIVGAGAIYEKNETSTLQLYFISATESTTTALDNAAVEGKAVKFIENGVLYIEKAGVRYNVMGQIIK